MVIPFCVVVIVVGMFEICGLVNNTAATEVGGNRGMQAKQEDQE